MQNEEGKEKITRKDEKLKSAGALERERESHNLEKQERLKKFEDIKVALKQKLPILIFALITVVTLTVALLGSQFNKITNEPMGEIARSMEYPQVNDGDENVTGTNECVKFDAFFLRDLNHDGVAEGIRGTCRKVGETDTLYMELKVQTNGRLENGVISINGENFTLQTSLPKDKIISENTIGNDIKTIKLNTVNNGSQKLIEGIIKSAITNNDTSKYSKKGKVTLTGTYIPDGQAEGTKITKEVQFDVDWHGSVRAQITKTNQNRNIETAMDEENDELKLNFTVYTSETKQELILKKSVVEGTIPLFNGQPPKRVECTNSNVKFNYDPDTREFTIERETTLNTDTKIVTDAISRNNNYTIKVVYPLEAYRTAGIETVELRIPVKAYYEGHNNTNSEFNNPEVSNKPQSTIVLTYEKPRPQPTVPGYTPIYPSKFDITVGKYVYEPTRRYTISKDKPLRIYNGLSSEEKDDNYLVTWYGYVGTYYGNRKMVMKERKNGERQVSDQFITTGGTNISMEEVTSNIGIYFSNPSSLLGAEGEIKVYDDELDELLMTFTKDNWSKYNSSTPYYYERPVKHIRVETTTVNKETSLYVYNIKQLDDEYITEHYDIDAFIKLEHIKSTLCGYIGDELVKVDTANAEYEAPYTIASINLNKTSISTQATEKNMNITIRATANENYNQVKWQNGVFLVKLPEDIVDVEINGVESTDTSVSILSFEQYKEQGNCYIKINSENKVPATYDIVIDVNISPNPTATTQTERVELYYYNANAVDYCGEDKTTDSYDLDGDLNTGEAIGRTRTSLSLLSPSSLLTSETITEYDNKQSITVAPQIAPVEKDHGTATINIQMKNNYNSTISEIKILGRVPYVGNKYVINGRTLESEYNLKMQGAISLPAELKNIAKVYYSDNIDATQDVTLASNNWKQDVIDFTNIKSYLIDFGDNKIEKNANYNISYKVLIPTDVDYNKVSYSHHAVYFSLDTAEGKYPTQTEPNKVGLMIAKQYDLELIKYQKGKENTVSGATYLIKEENTEESKTRTTDINGKLTVKDLYVERTYVIKEIKSPTSYELNETEVKFRVTEEGGVLKLVDNQTTKDKAKNIQVINPQGGEGYKVEVQVEDEVKASLKIVKTAKEVGTPLKGVRFKITGKNYEDGRNITTNTSGEATLTGLSIGEQYTLEEIKSKEGYYLASKITFTINNNGGNYTVEKAEENEQNLVTSAQVQETENIPTLTLNIDNEKIPEYTLKIKKVVKGKDEPLSGAKFRLFKGTEKIDDFTTDAGGNITIPNLYQYEDSRKIDQTYTLKELLAPDGYAQVKDITFYVTKNTEGSLTMEVKEGKIRDYTVDNESNAVTVTIEDSPSFKLIKKDGETGAPLPNTKFAIYNVDTGEEQLALDSKYNILGEKEEINGKTYYTLTTNAQGEIEANLREGLYKAVEIKASDEKYEITNNVYYFGIGESREAEKIIGPTWATSFGGSHEEYITSVAQTSDGGYIVGGYFLSDSITVGKYEFINKGGSGSHDGLVIKYSENGEVEWATSFGGSYWDNAKSVAQTNDGGYIVGGIFGSNNQEKSNITIGSYTLNGNGGSDVLLIKYSENGDVEWATSFGGRTNDTVASVTPTNDGGYIIGGNWLRCKERYYNNRRS